MSRKSKLAKEGYVCSNFPEEGSDVRNTFKVEGWDGRISIHVCEDGCYVVLDGFEGMRKVCSDGSKFI